MFGPAIALILGLAALLVLVAFLWLAVLVTLAPLDEDPETSTLDRKDGLQ